MGKVQAFFIASQLLFIGITFPSTRIAHTNITTEGSSNDGTSWTGCSGWRHRMVKYHPMPSSPATKATKRSTWVGRKWTIQLHRGRSIHRSGHASVHGVARITSGPRTKCSAPRVSLSRSTVGTRWCWERPVASASKVNLCTLVEMCRMANWSAGRFKGRTLFATFHTRQKKWSGLCSGVKFLSSPRARSQDWVCTYWLDILEDREC